MPENSSTSIFSFFSGLGFLDLGFERSNMNICFVNELHKPFLDAYKHARMVMQLPEPKYGYSSDSVENLVGDAKLNDAFEKEKGNLRGFIGGPPCPDFSVGGKNLGKEGENGRLSESYTDVICEMRPEFFLFENVKGLYRTKKHREFFDLMKMKLSKFYHLHERLINAIEYGAPQDRARIILLGFKKTRFSNNDFTWESQLYPDGKAFQYKWPVMDDFEVDSELLLKEKVPRKLTVQYWFDKNKVVSHPNAEHCFIPRAGKVRFESVLEGDDKKKSYKRLHRWRYSPTAAYGNNEVHLHPYKARRISAAEALALQSLPAKFELPSNMTLSNMFKGIGNGVPYLASLGLAKSIQKYIRMQNASYSQQSSECNQSTAE